MRRGHVEDYRAAHCNVLHTVTCRRFNGHGRAEYATDGASSMCVASTATPPHPLLPLTLRCPSPSRCRSDFTWSAGDVYDGEFKDHVRHGKARCLLPRIPPASPPASAARSSVSLAARYTWFNGESMECQWVNGRCDEWSSRNAHITASKPAAAAAAATGAEGGSSAPQPPAACASPVVVAGKPWLGSYRLLAAVAAAAAVFAGVFAAARARKTSHH